MAQHKMRHEYSTNPDLPCVVLKHVLEIGHLLVDYCCVLCDSRQRLASRLSMP